MSPTAESPPAVSASAASAAIASAVVAVVLTASHCRIDSAALAAGSKTKRSADADVDGDVAGAVAIVARDERFSGRGLGIEGTVGRHDHSRCIQVSGERGTI